VLKLQTGNTIIQTFSGRSSNDGITARKRQISHSFCYEKIHYSRKTGRPIDKPGELAAV